MDDAYRAFAAEFVRDFEHSGTEVARPYRKASVLLTRLDALRHGDVQLAADAERAARLL